MALEFSCAILPKEGEYRDYTYDKIVKRHGKPDNDSTYFIDGNITPGIGIQPFYPFYFTEEELEGGVEIRELIWEKSFNKTVIVWLKYSSGQWVVFDSLEYNSKYIAF